MPEESSEHAGQTDSAIVSLPPVRSRARRAVGDDERVAGGGAARIHARSLRADQETLPAATDGVTDAGGAATADSDFSSDWRQRTIDWLTSPDAGSLLASCVFHALLLGVMLLIALPMTRVDRGGIVAELGEGLDPADQLFESAPAEIQLDPVENTGVDSPLLQPALSDLLPPVGDPAENLEFDMEFTPGGNAVTAGSFTAWTEPEDPIPKEPYRITIQIRLPDETRRYPVSDLRGRVLGTDDYVQHLPIDRLKPFATRTKRGRLLVQVNEGDTLPIRDHTVQLIVIVPGAANLVKDRIEIESKMLKEKQVLEIEF